MFLFRIFLKDIIHVLSLEILSVSNIFDNPKIEDSLNHLSIKDMFSVSIIILRLLHRS
jgi:hypothetical protein